MKPILVTSGEPAGIGLDICLDLAGLDVPLVILADKDALIQRAAQLGREIHLRDYAPSEVQVTSVKNQLTVLHLPCQFEVTPGVLNSNTAQYVLDMLKIAAESCLSGQFSALVTAPVHKGIINDAGFAFTGHTEFFETQCGVNKVVMMLACDAMRVALVTTHLPLRNVADEITSPLIIEVITCLNTSLQRDFAIAKPRIWVSGLNPHAGEGGHLGREEIEIITPALNDLRKQQIDVQGPFPADTLFAPHNMTKCDVFVAMYHDQGLPVLKYAGFGNAVNVTLGLPIIRTSVDHGTALELAGTGYAQSSSLMAAVTMAADMVKKRGYSI
jgi:4-hydroxythreonine-4-phosphate dehydrogenase